MAWRQTVMGVVCRDNEETRGNTEASLMRANHDVLTSIHMRVSRQELLSTAGRLHTTRASQVATKTYADESHQCAFYTNQNVNAVRGACGIASWTFCHNFLIEWAAGALRPAFCAWPDASALLLLICVQESGQEDSTPFCFLFTFLPRSVCQSPWCKHARLLSSPFRRAPVVWDEGNVIHSSFLSLSAVGQAV